MEKQKFYLIFLICMLAIGIYSFKLGDFNLFSKTSENVQEVEEIPEPTMKEEIPETNQNKDEYSDTKGVAIRYIADKKTIVVTYENLPFSTRHNSTFYTFNGLNARDLGYKYVYIDNKKSNYRPDFTENDNISSGVKEFQNYILRVVPVSSPVVATTAIHGNLFLSSEIILGAIDIITGLYT